MRLHRLVLRNWRGIDEREVRFAPTGVTVVEGPNESGKSSLVEALDALFTHLDDSKRREVLAIKPVHRDAGAEVEAEVESGPYRFTFSKRFHKKPETKLSVSAPRAESLTGREAHERARQILEETMDLALWSALRIEQGQEVTQANLAGQKSLSAALDKAAGVARTGEAEETLFEAARREFERYFTPTGGARRETYAAEKAVEVLEADLAGEEAELARLLDDVERSAQLDREAVEATGSVAAAVRSQAHHDARLREIERLTGLVREKDLVLDAARASAREAEQRSTERASLIEEQRAAAEAFAELAEGEGLAAPAFDAAKGELVAAEAAFAAASEAADQTERAAATRQQDFDFSKDALDLELLGERKRRIERADAAAAQAEEVLARSAITDAVLKELQSAHLDAEKARAAFAAGSPELRLRALADIEPSIAGAPQRLAQGDETTHAVAGSLALLLPGVAEIEIRTGSSAANLRGEVDARSRDLAQLCHRNGVEGLDAAVQANAAWQAARRDVEARDRTLHEDLRDLTREAIAQKLANLAARVAFYRASRAAAFPIASGYDEAAEALRSERTLLDAAKQSRTAAERRRDAARRHVDRLREERSQAELGRERAHTLVTMTAARLEQARARASDEEVAGQVAATGAGLLAAERSHHEESVRLAGAQPDATHLLAENARAARRLAEERLRGIEDERIEVRARLAERGEAGLAERVGATKAKLVHASDDLALRRTHAGAAKLLFETLDAERSTARKAYVAPLRERIERLGRTVYGSDFGVELNDDLQIASRTLGGRTVPFESLSGGAKEQLGVIARLACALTVAEDGGVPVIFDDTLGNTDPARIETMGALIALAGRRCQVIVLTCVPDRFRYVGEATFVSVA